MADHDAGRGSQGTDKFKFRQKAQSKDRNASKQAITDIEIGLKASPCSASAIDHNDIAGQIMLTSKGGFPSDRKRSAIGLRVFQRLSARIRERQPNVNKYFGGTQGGPLHARAREAWDLIYLSVH